jgi:hypothetical protein
LTRATIEHAVAAVPPRFLLLERYDGLEQILQEHDISISVVCDRQAKLRIGRVHPAELYLFSGFLPLGGGLTIVAKIVETTDGRVTCFEDVYAPDVSDWAAVKYQIDGLVSKVEQYFPLAAGAVVDLQDGRARLDVGASEGVRAGTRFVATPARKSKGFDGSLYKHAGDRIELVVETVRETASTARIIPRAGGEVLGIGDEVHAR